MEQYTLTFLPEDTDNSPVSIGSQDKSNVIGASRHHLLRGGKPWYPVMGEFHYSRYPSREWEIELRKMKALGITIVATYVFWIHHEEEKGCFRTDGNLDLRQFLLTCREVGLEVMLRIGPWAHGECRNGGFPDWLMQESATIQLRTDDPAYLQYVRAFYDRIYACAQGLLFSDGGPVIGIQLENEYGHCGGESGGNGLVHMRTLKRLAVEAGFRVPIYTATGWGGANVVDGEMLPVLGGYADAPWEQSLTPLAPNANYLLQYAPNDPLIGSDWAREAEHFTYHVMDWPYLTAELGGGIQCTFHRRPLLSSMDTYALAVCKLATGANLLGYYMFHGGTHPTGKTTLQESTATGSYTDVPVLSYDFQAPLGEGGQVRESALLLKQIHLLLRSCGETLAASRAYYPSSPVNDPGDLSSLRFCARYNAKTQEGFLFVNNHQRGYTMQSHNEVAFHIEAGDAVYELPPLSIPDSFVGILPFHLQVGPGRLIATNCQLLTMLGDIPVLIAPEKVPAKVLFDRETPYLLLSASEAAHAWPLREGLGISSAVLMQLDDGILALSDTPEVTVRLLPEGNILSASTAAVSVSAVFTPISEGNEESVYRIALSAIPEDAMDDLLLDIDFTGDHAELYLEERMIADWYTTGQPWQVALKRHGYPVTLALRVYPVTRPVLFEIPTPEGCRLNRVHAHARYLLKL
ncbi:MAG: beta-galactosidase [Clostridia bacterium]|nr:beta-galactosidase [Clostridia bacterium]